jgi:hypothetical protein
MRSTKRTSKGSVEPKPSPQLISLVSPRRKIIPRAGVPLVALEETLSGIKSVKRLSMLQILLPKMLKNSKKKQETSSQLSVVQASNVYCIRKATHNILMKLFQH